LFTATPPTPTYTLSLHDALPISQLIAQLIGQTAAGGGRGDHGNPAAAILPALHRPDDLRGGHGAADRHRVRRRQNLRHPADPDRSEEHTSELQSRSDLVCRLLLE